MKLLKYRTAGVREYWVVNPMTNVVMVYNFENESQNDQYAFSDTITSHVLENYTVCMNETLGES